MKSMTDAEILAYSIAQARFIMDNVEVHKYLQHIPDREKGIADFICKFAWVFRAGYEAGIQTEKELLGICKKEDFCHFVKCKNYMLCEKKYAKESVENCKEYKELMADFEVRR